MFVENHIFYTFDLGIHFLTVKMTLKMTLNHQNNTIDRFSRQKSHRKEVLHLFVVLSVRNHIFHILDLEIEVLTLTMTFNHQNNTRMDYQIKIKHKYYTSCYLCLLKVIFCYTFDLRIDLLTLKITLQMTFNHQNNTINRFSSQNSMK